MASEPPAKRVCDAKRVESDNTAIPCRLVVVWDHVDDDDGFSEDVLTYVFIEAGFTADLAAAAAAAAAVAGIKAKGVMMTHVFDQQVRANPNVVWDKDGQLTFCKNKPLWLCNAPVFVRWPNGQTWACDVDDLCSRIRSSPGNSLRKEIEIVETTITIFQKNDPEGSSVKFVVY